MIDLGTVKPGSTIRIPFSSFDKDDGSSITMTNFAVADILIYKDGNTTARASTAGFTATTDFNSKTGKHLIVIDLADNTTADFYASGSEYLVAIDAVTVDAVTTGGWVARFRIGYPNAMLDTTIATLASQTSFTLTNGPAEDDVLNNWIAVIHDAASSVQATWVVVLDYTGSTKTVTLAASPATTFTVAAKDNISFMYPAPLMPTTTGRTVDVAATGEVGLDFNNILSSSLITLHSLTVTGATTLTGAVSLGSTLGISGTVTLAAVNANTFTTSGTTTLNALTVTGALTAGTNAIPWNAAWDAEVQSEVDDAIIARNLQFLVTVAGTADSGSTTTMVDAARTEGDNDYWKGQKIVWTSGTIAGQSAIITDFVAATDTFTFAPATTQVVGTQTYVILPNVSVWEDTLAEHLVSGSTGSALNAAGSAGDPWATALPGAYGAGTAGRLVGRSLPDVVAGGAGGLFIAGSNAATTLATLTVSGATTLTGTVSATNASNDIRGVRLSATGVDDVWDELTAGHVTVGTFGQVLFTARANTASAGGATSITLDGSASATNDFYNNDLLVITGGTGAGQARFIDDYVGSTQVATVATWAVNPDNTSQFVIIPSGPQAIPSAATVADAVWDEARSGHTTVGTFGEYVLADTTLISGDGVAADRLETMLDGTGGNTLSLGAMTVTGATTLATLSVSGAATFAAGLAITNSTTNGPGLSITGNGTGAGILSTGGATGAGFSIVGGGTSGHGILITATSGHGFFSTGGGTDKYGFYCVGSASGSSATGFRADGGTTGGHGGAFFGSGAGNGWIATAGPTGAAGLQGYGGSGTAYGILGKSGATGGAGAFWWGWGGDAPGEYSKGNGAGAATEVEGAYLVTTTWTATGAVTASNASNQIVLGADMITSSTLHATAIQEIWTTALTEAYRATGATGTAAQLMYEIMQHLGDFAINADVKTMKKIDGTTAKTYQLDSATAPTSITELT